ncbi:MAG: hypothetical protein P4L83_00535 [Nevskia sp.]|nr:hypothetical protein [Nevskia sp.]
MKVLRNSCGLLALLFAACQSCPVVTPAERVVTQTVKVPVAAARTPPPEVLGCRAALPPLAQFHNVPGGLLLPTAEIPVFLAGEAAQMRCDNAWRAWAGSP